MKRCLNQLRMGTFLINKKWKETIMSNILEQKGITFVPIRKEKTLSDYSSEFCSFLNNIKTPLDIYEGVQIQNVKFIYAAEYAASLSATLDWEAQVTKSEQGEITQYLDSDHADCEIAATIPANIKELSELDKDFFVDENYILMSLVQDIIGEIKLIKDNEIDNNAIDFCKINSAELEEFDMNGLINQQINNRAEEIYKGRYKNCHYYINSVDVNMSEPTIFSVLVPILLIEYTYFGTNYHCFINAHSDAKASLLSHKGVFVGTLPEDTNKSKGLFGKIKSGAEKIKHKNQQKDAYQSRFVSEFQKYIG